MTTYIDAQRDRYGVARRRQGLAQLGREGVQAARCTVERLMRRLGIRGVVRGNTMRTTVPDKAAARSADMVNRHFRAPAPNRLSVAGLTYVKTNARWVYVACIVDAFSRYVVGWQASRSPRTDLAFDASEKAIWAGRGEPPRRPHSSLRSRRAISRYSVHRAPRGC